jgi:hypothetical protein
MVYFRYFCVCFRIVVSNAYCVVFFCFSSSYVHYVVSFSGLSIFDCPFGILYRLCINSYHMDDKEHYFDYWCSYIIILLHHTYIIF